MTDDKTLQPGEVLMFNYNCDRSDESEHVEWRNHDQQRVTVVGLDDENFVDDPEWALTTYAERLEAAMPWTYTVRWADGFEGAVFEDELTRV